MRPQSGHVARVRHAGWNFESDQRRGANHAASSQSAARCSRRGSACVLLAMARFRFARLWRQSFIIVGVATEIGIEPTARHGADLGYVPVLSGTPLGLAM